MKQYYVYIMSSYRGTLYTGVTNDLERRVAEHRDKNAKGFVARYNITTLVYFDETSDIKSAIMREKEIKGWLRTKKVKLIESMNPAWKDLAADWG